MKKTENLTCEKNQLSTIILLLTNANDKLRNIENHLTRKTKEIEEDYKKQLKEQDRVISHIITWEDFD